MANEIDELKFDNGELHIKKGEDEYRIAQPEGVPEEVFKGVESAFMRHDDYTKKSQELSEINKKIDGLEAQLRNVSGGPSAVQNAGQNNASDASTAPGGGSSSFASPAGSGNGQANGTNAANQGSSPDFDFNFDSAAPDNAGGNQQSQGNGQFDVNQAMAQLYQNQKQHEQELIQMKQERQEERKLQQMQSEMDNFDPNKIEQEISSLPDSQRQEYTQMPRSAAMELYHRRNYQNQGGDGNDAANRQPAQDGGSDAQGKKTPYASPGNTSGPSGNPQGNEVVSDTDGIADHINEVGLGNQTEDQASLGKRPG